MTHALKTWPEHFSAVLIGEKPYELRKADRSFAVGDMLWLQEYDNESKKYTGRTCERRVTHVLTGPTFGLLEGYVILGLGRKGAEAERFAARVKGAK